MADKISNLKKWKNNEKLNARDYVYERDTISGTVNTIIDEQETQDGLLEGLRTDVDQNRTDIDTNDTDIANLESNKVDRAGDTITGNLIVEGSTDLNTVSAASADIASLNVSGTNVLQTASDVIGLKNGDVLAHSAKNTNDGVGNANTAQAIKQTVDNVNQDVKDTATPTFVGVTLGDKTLTNQKLVDLDAAKTHADITTGNPHGVTASDLSLGNVDNTSDADKPISTATGNALANKADLVTVNVEGVDKKFLDPEQIPLDVARLGDDDKVLPGQLPSYVDDIVEFNTFADLPASGSTGKIYIVKSDPDPAKNTSYRWSGSEYFVFDQNTARWGSISGTVTDQTDVENATFTSTVSEGNISGTTLKTSINDLDTALKTTNTNVSTNAANISSNDSDIATNAANIATNAANISSNDSDIATNAAGIATNVSDIATNAADIATNAANITSNDSDIATNAADIATNATNITSNDADIATNAQAISNIEDGTTDITFDPASSGLDSTTVEAAIKEIYAEKAQPNGIATLDVLGRIPSEQLPLDAIEFKGTFGDGTSTTGGDLPTEGVTKGDLYISNTNAFTSTVASLTFNSGDKALYDGTAWRKNDAFDAVASVNGLLGAVTINTENTATNTTNFDGFLGANDDTVQKALDKFDDHVHTFAEITEKPTTIATFGITDAYTKTELDSGQLDGQYYTETELDNGQLDNRYYTEVELDSFLADKLDVGVLAANIKLYPTSATGDFGYNRAVTSLDDPDYDSPAVDITTPLVNGAAVPVGALIADANLFLGNPGVLNVPIVGNVRSSANNVEAEFYFEIYKRDEAGVEELLGTSDTTQKVSTQTYEEFSANALLNNGEFLATDRLVFKFYANKLGSVDGTFDFQYGGSAPVRILLNVPIAATLQAERIAYDTSNSTLTETNLQSAMDELDVKLESNITTIKLETFDIINPDIGGGQFTYQDANLQTQTGTIDAEGFYEFDLQVAGYYVNNNLVEVNINDDTHYYTSDGDQLREGDADSEGVARSVKIKHSFNVNDEIDVRYYQGLNIAASAVGDGSVSFAKLSAELQDDITDVREASPSNGNETIVRRNASNEFQGILDGKFKTPRTIAIAGDVTGQAQFDGSSGITIQTVVSKQNFDGGNASSVFSPDEIIIEGGGA